MPGSRNSTWKKRTRISRNETMSGRALVISLHDVSPQTRAACAEILAQLAVLGVPRCSLLVIPDHHRRGHFLADAGCVTWLRVQAAAGHELVMHGYFHQ